MRPGPGCAPGLYASILGPDFARLAPALRHFHGQREGGRARGRLRVWRGSGPLARVAGWVIAAPSAGAQVPVELVVELRAGREIWTRAFPGRAMVTRQWRRGDELVEALGPSTLSFALSCSEQGGMAFEQRGCRLLGLPLPRCLSPRVRAQARPSPGGEARAWELEVEIALPLLGTIVGYSGTMVAEP